MSITRELRALAGTVSTDHPSAVTNALLDIANRVETLEGNFLNLISITCQTGDVLAGKKTTSKSELQRQIIIMEICQNAIDGRPAWRHHTTKAVQADRVMRTFQFLLQKTKERNPDVRS